MEMRTIISEAVEAAEKAAEEKAAIKHAVFCIENGIGKDKVIELIAEELKYSNEEAAEFFEKEISGKLSK